MLRKNEMIMEFVGSKSDGIGGSHKLHKRSQKVSSVILTIALWKRMSVLESASEGVLGS